MNSICLVIPYFGKLPSFFPMWLYTATFNPTINFLIITDDEINCDVPDNVNMIKMSFAELRKQICDLFDFDISLNRPYKLCDFRPAYGEIFSDKLKKYDFWGYCDLDVILGDIRGFMSEEILNNYDKIGYLGHFSIYRNTERVNSGYRLAINGQYAFIEAFSREDSAFFDEIAINDLFEKNGLSVYRKTIMADISALHRNFRLGYNGKQENNRKQILFWKEGHLYTKYISGNVIESNEYMYAHFLQRNMKYDKDCIGHDEFCIVPNRVIPMKEHDITVSFIKENSTDDRMKCTPCQGQL